MNTRGNHTPAIALTVSQPAIPLAPLLTIKQVAALLGVHRTTVYDLIRHADLPVTHLGTRSTRISATDLQLWLNQRKETAS